MSAAFQYNLKRRPFFRPYSLLVTESEPKTHNKRFKGDTFRVAPGAPRASVQGLLSYFQFYDIEKKQRAVKCYNRILNPQE